MPWKLHSSNLAWRFSYPLKNYRAVFASSGLLDELLNKFSYPGLGRPMEFIPPESQLLKVSYPGQFTSALVPRIKEDRSLKSIKTRTGRRCNNCDHSFQNSWQILMLFERAQRDHLFMSWKGHMTLWMEVFRDKSPPYHGYHVYWTLI